MILELPEAELLELIKTEKKVVLDVWMDNCPFCEKYAPIFESVSGMFPDIKFAKFHLPRSTGGQSEIKKLMTPENGKVSAPATLIFENGELKTKKYGFIEEHELIELIGTGVIDPSPKIANELRNLYAMKGEIITMSEQLPGINEKIAKLRIELDKAVNNARQN